MSDDLISREALKKEFDDKCAYECAICKYAKDFAPCKLIDNAPTVERSQGEWVTHYEASVGFSWLTCSRCLYRSPCIYNFCPNCGAKMRKEIENE